MDPESDTEPEIMLEEDLNKLKDLNNNLKKPERAQKKKVEVPGKPENIEQISMRKLSEDFHQQACNLFIISRTWGGKTTFLKNLINKKKFTNIFLISRTSANTGEWDRVVPREFQFKSCNSHLFEYIADFQEQHPKSKCLLILDDYIDGTQNQIKKTPELIEFATSGRHKNITTIYSTQNFKSIPPAIRSQPLFVICGRNWVESCECIASAYANKQFSKKDLIENIMGLEGDRYDWLVLSTKGARWKLLPQEEIDTKKFRKINKKNIDRNK